jgi:hypothetical protein
MSRLRYLIATCVLALTVGGANANTITTFDVEGTFSTPVTFSGTLTVDVTVGTVTAVDIVVPGFSDFTSVALSQPSVGWLLESLNSDSFLLGFDFTTSPNPASLIGFIGGTITDGVLFSQPPGNQCGRGEVCLTILSGSLTPTPLPPSLALFASVIGLLGLGLAWRRRSCASDRRLSTPAIQGVIGT